MQLVWLALVVAQDQDAVSLLRCSVVFCVLFGDLRCPKAVWALFGLS